MEVFKEFFFKIIGPMIWLIFFSYGFAVTSRALAKAWKENNFKLIWLNMWVILIGVYFLFWGGI